MANHRVYATDSFYVRTDTSVYQQEDGGWGGSVGTEGQWIRGQSLWARTSYDLVARWEQPNNPIMYPVVDDDSYAIATIFDYRQSPELRGKRGKKTMGPYLFLTGKYDEMGYTGGIPSSWMSTRGGTFIVLRNSRPSDFSATSHLNVSVAKTDAYFNVNNHGASPFYQFSDGTNRKNTFMCAHVYPKVDGYRYYGSVEIRCDSHTGANPPYMDVEYEDILPHTEHLSPGSTANANQPITFSWSYTYDSKNMIGTIVQQSAKLRWRKMGTAEYTQYDIAGDVRSYTLPANTFDSSAIEWQVALTFNDTVKAEDPVWQTVQVQNPVIKPDQLSPRGALINGAIDNRFSWTTPGVNDAEQAAHEAQYSNNNGLTWQPLSSANASRKHFDVPGGFFITGTYRWRVRCRNNAGVWGPWSESAVVLVQSALQPPVIVSVTNTPRPSVTWTSMGQQAWQMQVGGYDSGEVYGTALTWKVPVYLAPGPTKLRLRIANVFGLWSAWTEVNLMIENQSGPAVTLSARQIANGVELDWSTTGAYSRYYIYRDGVPAAHTTSKKYRDYKAVGRHSYTIRAVTAGDYYSDSNPIYAISRVRAAVLAELYTLENTPDWIELEYVHGTDARTDEESREVLAEFVHYDGRGKPVAELSEFEDATHTLTFAVSREDDRRLAALLGRTVLYKSCYGDRFIGLLHQYSGSKNSESEVTLTITETDCREGVDFV